MFAITVPGFSLANTFDSRQSLMWRKVFTIDGECYIVTHRDKFCKVSQAKDRILVSGSEEDFYDVWFDYFDLSVDYAALDMECKTMCYPVARASRCVYGVHMLNLDPVESMLTQLLWWKCDSIRARDRLRTICDLAGTHKKRSYPGVGQVEVAFIPTLEELNGHQKLLEDILGPIATSRVVSLFEFIESHQGLLNASERFGMLDIRDWLLESGFYTERQTARILRDGYGFREQLCAPKRMERDILRWSDESTASEWSKSASSKLGLNVAYAGMLVQTATGV